MGVLIRKNALLIFMSVELQLNAVNLTLVAFSRMHGNLNGQVLAFFSMVVAAAEVVVGLAIIVSVYRRIQIGRTSTTRGARADDAPACGSLWLIPAAPAASARRSTCSWASASAGRRASLAAVARGRRRSPCRRRRRAASFLGLGAQDRL